MQIVRIRETGNALAITIPRPYLRQLNWALGETLVLEIVERQLQVRALRNHYQPQLRPPAVTQEAPSGAA